ncbi:Alpha/beta hydrolase family-domain-containing protein [Aspergillus keveii]|uniref:Alpha/beta hydrolase family-domain-containing protein n=1 Tax=Aspergillus keveii TaxID=714993 RepID=A0ABR4G6L4_9EURO
MASAKFKVIEHTIPCQSIREYHRAVKPNTPASALRLSVKQYIPLRENTTPGPDDVTIIAGHANGIPKECYEPLFEELLSSSSTKFNIKAIWFADCAHQGASGVLNERVLGDDPSWFDYSRDLLLMVNHFRNEIQPPIVGTAHSFSCAQFIHLSITHPSLFQSLILLEPTIQSEPPIHLGGRNPALWASTRRDRWTSREDAGKYIRGHPYWRSWDARCVEGYVRFGLRPVAMENGEGDGDGKGNGAVTLTTSNAQEAWTFLRFNGAVPSPSPSPSRGKTGIDTSTSTRDTNQAIDAKADFHASAPWPALAYELLPYIRPTVLYIFGSKSQMNVPARRAEKLQRTGIGHGGSGGAIAGSNVVRAEVLEGASHMLPLERVAETAGVVAGWVGEQVEVFRAERGFWEGFDGAIKSEEKEGVLGLSERWMRDVREPLGSVGRGRGRVGKAKL